MKTYIEKTCPKCGQQLRIPEDIGGMLMACPSCGKKLYSDFRMAQGKGRPRKGMVVTLFELPDTVWQRVVRFFFSRRR